jgi:RNA polymerase sigma-70 factor (ECF subfamily)
MPGKRRSDLELLCGARSGDGQAFGEFYRRHRALVLAFLGRRVGNPELAADLLAETFAAALAAVLDIEREPPSEPIAWLITIARNKLTDSLRRGRVEETARLRLGLEPLSLEDADLQRVEELIDRTDVAGRLGELLTPEQLEALQARILHERDYSDIARELRCSQAVVRKRVSRALQTLRDAMEGLK